jgi:Ca-activated chloride channel homolog
VHFAHPELLWGLWLVPLFVLALTLARRSAARRLRGFVAEPLAERMAGTTRPGARILRAALRASALALLVIAAARPQWGANEVELEQTGIDLVVALDISRSMLAEDLKPNRLERAKAEIADLVESMAGDRVGLVFFAGGAFPQCPLTVDYSAVRMFLSQADPSMISSQGTDLADALRTALELFPEETGRSRIVLVVTDGEDFGEHLEAAVQQMREADVVLYAVGIGTADGAPIPDVDDAGRRSGFVRDRDGQVVITRLQERPLLELVRATEGMYARAGSAGLDVERLRAELRAIEGSTLRTQRVVSFQDRYAHPLLAALVLLCLELWIGDRRRRVA